MTTPQARQRKVLHAVRLLGYATGTWISERVGVPAEVTSEVLLEAQAAGHVAWSQFHDESGWSLTETGKMLGEQLLSEELERSDARSVVESVMTEFEVINHVVTEACTRWQLADMGISESPAKLTDILADLSHAADRWHPLEVQLAHNLPRFQGYHDRFQHAIEQAHADSAWVTAMDRDSAHRVWFELHEDLLATLGRSR